MLASFFGGLILDEGACIRNFKGSHDGRTAEVLPFPLYFKDLHVNENKDHKREV